MKKKLVILSQILLLTVMTFAQETKTLIADGILDKPAKADLQPGILDLTFNEIEFVGKTVLKNDVSFEVLPQMSAEESGLSKEFELLDAAEGFFISREIKSRAYLYVAYSKKMNRNYQGIMVVNSLSNSTKFDLKAHFVYRHRGDKFIRKISDISGNSLDEIAIFSHPPSKKGDHRYVRIVEFSPDGIEKIGSREIYSSILQKQRTPYSIDKNKPAKRVYTPPIVTAVKLYATKKLGKTTEFYEERWRKWTSSWAVTDKLRIRPAEFEEDKTNYVELIKPIFPKDLGETEQIKIMTTSVDDKLPKKAECYVIVYAEPFVKKEYDKIYLKEFQLLDVCPEREPGLQYQEAKIKIYRDGKYVETSFEPIRIFSNRAEAKEFQRKYGVRDESMLLMDLPKCKIIRVIGMPLQKRPDAKTTPTIALLDVCLPPEANNKAHPVISFEENGKKVSRIFEVIKTFKDRAEAKKYAAENGVIDMEFSEGLIYTIHDGAGNKYVITENSLEYVPIKPMQSSSGIYDGGDYVKRKLTADEYKSVVEIVTKAIVNDESHTDQRAKGNPTIMVDDKLYILKMNSEIAKKLVHLLKKLKDS